MKLLIVLAVVAMASAQVNFYSFQFKLWTTIHMIPHKFKLWTTIHKIPHKFNSPIIIHIMRIIIHGKFK
ncbi:unnamed protein product [Leptidea sinapis]|uniref:Uncharacterized protein n=1 Tax=Leptidea sinapis TaxID=189913 RepID=A0A5E4QR65_9NEOP|nr:unnamed protein product [Leptidea sinapis]